jgi:hypothetical protein
MPLAAGLANLWRLAAGKDIFYMRRFVMKTELEERLADVAQLRQACIEAKEIEQAAYAAMLATPAGLAYNNARATYEAFAERVKDTETRAKALIIDAFMETGNKKPAPGAGIRVGTPVLSITDMAAAVTWAKANMPIALVETVDEQRVVAQFKDAPALPAWMVRMEGKVTPTLATDLSAYLQA